MSSTGHRIREVRDISEWREEGLCRGYPQAMWFPGRGVPVSEINQALNVCARCPVLAECREYALQFSENDLPGIWGGMTGKKRSQERKLRRKSAATLRQIA